MTNEKKKQLTITLLSLCVLAILTKVYRNNFLSHKGNARLQNKANLQAIDSMQQHLQAGDIVYRHGADAISDLFCKMNQTDQSFSHLGILLKHHDSLLVYHSIGGEDNPDEKIRVETFAGFVTPKHNTAFGYSRLPISTNALVRLDSITTLWHAQQRTFDMKFDLLSEQKLYCAEFVYKAYRLALQDTTLFSLSQAKNLIYVAPDNVLLEPRTTQRAIYNYR